MDPALCERLQRADESEEIEAIIRLDRPDVDPRSVRIIARFGRIATCRVARSAVPAVHGVEQVRSLKAARLLGPEHDVGSGTSGARRSTDRRRPPHLPLTGAGVVVGAVDWGCDVDHDNFRHDDGSTRLLALWDQRDGAPGPRPAPYGYGAVHWRYEIDRALRSGWPYEALGYHPADADRDGRGSHGTHVLDIAAGNGRAGGPVGVAPHADLVFVHLADRDTGGLASLGDSVRLLEAVDFIARTAGRRPWVVNISIGRCGGPHDGSSLVELALDELLRAAPGRAACMSAGNYFGAGTHASARAAPGGPQRFRFVVDEADLTPNELEVWYPGDDEHAVVVQAPSGTTSTPLPLGARADLVDDGLLVGRIYHRARDPNNGDRHVDLFLDAGAPAGQWSVTLHPVRVRDGTIDAWLERDESCRPCQARFHLADRDTRATTGTIANARLPIVVGAYDAHTRTPALAPFTSSGPTRDGRARPDLVAPGVDVLAARSAPAGSKRSPGRLARKSGTSMAAPHATGAVALCLEADPRLDAIELRELVQRTAAPPPVRDGRYGRGLLDVERLVAAVTARQPPSDQPPTPIERKELTMSHLEPAHLQPAALSLGADRLYRELTYRPDGPLATRCLASFTIVARPGEEPAVAPRAGDLLVRVALGEPAGGHLAVLAESTLMADTDLAASGSGEQGGPGWYAAVVEEGAAPHVASDRFARRVLDRSGRMPVGQLLLRPVATPAAAGDAWLPAADDTGKYPELVEPLTEAEWGLVLEWLAAGSVDGTPLTGNADDNALVVAAAIFCKRRNFTDPDDHPRLCIDPAVTAADARVVALAALVAARGPIVNWVAVPEAGRRLHVMELLVGTYGYPVNAAAGLVGNFYGESAVLPNRVGGSDPPTPMRAPDFGGTVREFTAGDVMNRRGGRSGPRRGEIGIAQWVDPGRRAGLFAHSHWTKPAGARIVFDMDAQVDYVVTELRSAGFGAVERQLRRPTVTVDEASDIVLLEYEIPGVVAHNPRAHPDVQAAIRRRRGFSRTALDDYRAAHPAPAAEAEDAAGRRPTDRRRAELTELWNRLMLLRAKRERAWESLQDNPLYIEAQIARALLDLTKAASDMSSELWSDLRAFASCDTAPLSARIEADEKAANAVLRVLHGLSSILQGHLSDQLDDGVKQLVERGWNPKALKVLVKVLKRQLPVIKKEVDTGGLRAKIAAFEQLKTQIADEGLDPTVVWTVAVDLAYELFANALDEAVATGAERAVKRAATRILKSAASASAVLFLAEELFQFVHAVSTIGAHAAYDQRFNALLLKFLAMLREEWSIEPGRHTYNLSWNLSNGIPGERIECRFVLRSFDPERGASADEGEGRWRELPLKGAASVDGLRIEPMKTKIDVAISAGSERGRQQLVFDLPDRASGSSYVAAELTMFGKRDRELDKAVSLVAPAP